MSHAHTSIKKLELINREANLDIARGGEGRQVSQNYSPKCTLIINVMFDRPDQLILMDDPYLHPELLPELDLGVLNDLSLADLESGDLTDLADSLDVRSFTPQNNPPFSPGGPGTSPGTSPGTAGGSPGFRPAYSSFHGDRQTPVPGGVEDNLQFEDHPSFGFDEQGVMREVTPELPLLLLDQDQTPIPTPSLRLRQPQVPGSHLTEDVEEQVRREHEEGGIPDLGVTAIARMVQTASS